MKKTKKMIALALTGITLSVSSLSIYAAANQSAANGEPANIAAQEQAILKANPTMDKKALDTAVCAYTHLHDEGKDPQQILSFINYHKPSNEKRFWVINMKDSKVIYNTYVAQGKGTGMLYAKHFSNQPGSDASSLGVYLTGNTYNGEHGYSLRLHGLDNGFNNNVYKRAVVMHSAWYVGQKFVKAHGYTGRSWGCTALSQRMEPKVVSKIKDGTVLVGYFPDKAWLDHSKYTQPVA